MSLVIGVLTEAYIHFEGCCEHWICIMFMSIVYASTRCTTPFIIGSKGIPIIITDRLASSLSCDGSQRRSSGLREISSSDWSAKSSLSEPGAAHSLIHNMFLNALNMIISCVKMLLFFSFFRITTHDLSTTIQCSLYFVASSLLNEYYILWSEVLPYCHNSTID